MRDLDDVRIGIIGLGYVGLPLAVAFGRRFPVTGFDVKPGRIAELAAGRDVTLEVSPEELASADRLVYSSRIEDLKNCNVFIVTVPTPIDEHKRPDLSPLERASHTVGRVLSKGDLVVYESTVYPGATEEVCVPILERESGLRFNEDFFAGLQPRAHQPRRQGAPAVGHREGDVRVHPGSGRPRGCAVRARSSTAGTHRASSIRVAEAAKVIENTQRDVNIALVNELAMIFERARHRHRRGAGRRGIEVELPALPARPRGRALHRRRPLLPDLQGAGDGLSPGDDPRRPPDQRQHGPLRRVPRGAADD